MIRIKNCAMTRMPGAERKRSGFRNGVLFSVLAAGAAVLAGITGTGYVTVLAADNVKQNQVMAGDDSLRLTGGGTSGDVDDSVNLCSPSPDVDGVSDSTYTSSNLRTDVQPEVGRGLPSNDDVNIPDSQADDIGGVYDFKDNKTTGTVTVTKVWDDGLTNDEREIPDIKISTKKPTKSTLGYTVTFHGNGLKFADGSEENIVIYNSAGEIVQGEYKMAVGNNVAWYSDRTGKGKIDISSDGSLILPINKDVDLWAKEMTFEIKGYDYSLYEGNGFNKSIPSTVTEVIFTEEIKPASAEVIDVDADGDDGVIAWTENNGTVMKVSTQIKGIKVQAAVNSSSMFDEKSKIKKIDFKMLDTSNVISMNGMFSSCSGLTSLDLTGWDTSKVTNMESMFYGCIGLTSLDLTPLDTSKVTDMMEMFSECRSLTNLDMTGWDTSKVTDMYEMFSYCNGLTSLDLTSLNTSNVTNMYKIFFGCCGLTSLDLTGWDTSKVTEMGYMFSKCNGLTSLDLTPLDTSKVTNMEYMFYGCSGLTSLDLTPLDASNVTNMRGMFRNCSGLTSLDLTPLDTSNVENMYEMFSDCSGLTSLNLTGLDTSKVTNMSEMFFRCGGLTNLDLTGWNTSNVTYMVSMFCWCSGLKSLDLSCLNVSKVTTICDKSSYGSGFLSHCSELQNIILPNFTNKIDFMSYMFYDCTALTNINLTPLDTSNVTGMFQMFDGCSGLISLDLTPLNTSNVTNISYMFYDCSGLTILDLTPLNTSKVTNMKSMFDGCNSLTSLDLTSFDTAKVTNMEDMFSSGLTTLKTGTAFKFVGEYYYLPGTWQNTTGETFNGNKGTANFPSNVADTYTKISD